MPESSGNSNAVNELDTEALVKLKNLGALEVLLSKLKV